MKIGSMSHKHTNYKSGQKSIGVFGIYIGIGLLMSPVLIYSEKLCDLYKSTIRPCTSMIGSATRVIGSATRIIQECKIVLQHYSITAAGKV